MVVRIHPPQRPQYAVAGIQNLRGHPVPCPEKEQDRTVHKQIPYSLRRHDAVVPRAGSQQNRALSRACFHKINGSLHIGSHTDEAERYGAIRVGDAPGPSVQWRTSVSRMVC